MVGSIQKAVQGTSQGTVQDISLGVIQGKQNEMIIYIKHGSDSLSGN